MFFKRLEESAKIDGAGVLQTMIRIYLPLSKSSLVVIGLWCMVGHWNAWLDILIYANEPKFIGLQVLVQRLLQAASGAGELEAAGGVSGLKVTTVTMQAATIMIAVTPILCVYPFLQKHLVKGTMIGSIKG